MAASLSAPVLVLNANYEPLNVCTVRRALGLLLSDKAHLVLNGRGEIATVQATFEIPSVIRLDYMVRRPRPRPKLCREEIFRRDGYICQYCGRRVRHPTIDHVMPRRLGGKDTWENLVTACAACNTRKGGRTLAEAHMRLLRKPEPPPMSAFYRFRGYLHTHREWEDFLRGW